MPIPQFFPKKRDVLLPHPSLLCVIWGEGGSDPRSAVMGSETVFEIERNRAMKTTEAIKSRARLVSMGNGRAATTVRRGKVPLVIHVLTPGPVIAASRRICEIEPS